MVHVGIDLHKKSSYFFALDDLTGELLLNEEVPSDRQALLDCLVPFCQGRGEVRLVLEACGFAGFWSDVLDPLGEVVAVHPKHVKGFQGKDKTKNDRRDAQFLVDLSRINRLPRAYLGRTAERDLKDFLRYSRLPAPKTEVAASLLTGMERRWRKAVPSRSRLASWLGYQGRFNCLT